MRRKDKEVTEQEKIEAVIRQCRTCHVAMTEGGRPYVVPLSFGYRFLEDGILELYFHSAQEGKKLDILQKNSSVCFELSQEGELIQADSPCGFSRSFSSVIGFGKVVFLENTADKCAALSALFRRQTGQDVVFNAREAKAVLVFKIISREYSGKQYSAAIRLPGSRA